MSLRVPMAFVTEPGVAVLREQTLPDMGAEDVTIRVSKVTLCGGDLHIFRGKHPAVELPIPVGHEICGEVIETGAQVTHLQPGDRVAVEPVITCGRCFYCLRGQYHLCTDISFQYRRGQGGLTTHMVVPERWAHKLPANIDDEQGALIEPLSVALHAVRKSGIQAGGSSVVFGAGAIGLFATQIIRAMGGGEIIVVDIDPYRLESAVHFGATSVFDNREDGLLEMVRARTGGLGADRVFEAVGLELTLRQALSSVRKGGTVVVIGLFETQDVRLPANIFVQKEISLIGSQGYHWDFQTAIEMTAAGKFNLKDMITHRFKLGEIQEALEVLTDPRARAIKVLVDVGERAG